MSGEGSKCVIFQLRKSFGHVHSFEFSDEATGAEVVKCVDKGTVDFLKSKKVTSFYKTDSFFTQFEEENYKFDHYNGSEGMESKRMYMQTEARYGK